ncbi:MAG: hypothetical protein ABS45_12875 [Comamonas sp. SCN 65-56]|uniref:hypothetical protein n=1 Tax=Comamonas sp. SCN 65-56 TaxID=1660095 RepID=UPI00086B980B|nr:hypothetical protein [Comamonas sp. SCN 65-56]ODS91028.1 MAG: hypothetical protein ABS45_12875 [Comamonas sp. SCN 65-56]
MPSTSDASSGPVVGVQVMALAEIQDALLTSLHDLHRLEGLLDHAATNLIQRFASADAALSPQALMAQPELAGLRDTLRSAVTELQFHDMATQLITHTSKVLQACSDRLGAQAMGSEAGEEAAAPDAVAPDRPNPVTQSEMDAGSIELF